MSEVNISWSQYDKDIHALAKKIEPFINEFSAIYGIKRGGYIPAVHLSHLLKLPIVDYYQHKEILIVDELVDSGNQLSKIALNQEVRTAVLYRKDCTVYEPRFFVKTINNYINFPWEK